MLKILYFDIEKSPEKVYVYQKYDAAVIGREERSILFSIAWSWEGQKTIHCVTNADFPAFKKNPHDDYGVTKKAWDLLNEADLVIAYNGDRFDIKELNTYFIYHGLGPVSPFISIDPLKIAKRYFRFFGNSLNDLAEFFEVGKKVETKKGLWYACLNATWKDTKPYREMAIYNKHDVYLLKIIYKILSPWNKVPKGLQEGLKCPVPGCESPHVQSRGFRIAVGGRRQQYVCTDCGHWFSPLPSVKLRDKI